MTRSPSTAPRGGFTAIELLVVLGIIILLMSMSVPGLVGALRKGKVNDAANTIVRVSSQGRQLARTRQIGAATKFYGMVLVNDETPAYAALTYGTTASKTTILHRGGDPTKPEVCKLNFNRNITLMLDAAPLTAELGWMYQYRTGYPIIVNNITASSVNIGAPNLPAVDAIDSRFSKVISVMTIDGKYKSAVAIYQIGLANIQDY
jgi:type II secretory pathway pseudopilin PulG